MPLLDPEILRQVLGPGICQLLERMCRHNMLVCRDYRESRDGRPRYRLHALLREFLRHEGTKQLAPADACGFASRAADELLARSEDEAARECLIEARDWRRLAAHLEQTAEALFTSGCIRSLTRFLNALPESERDRSAELRYWHGLCILPLDPAQSRRELTAAYQRFRACGDDAGTIRAWGAAIDSIWFEWEDCARLDPLIGDLPALQAAARRLNTAEPMNVLIKGAFAALSLRRPDHPDFKDWEEKNLALFQRRLPKSETIQRGLQLMIHYVYGSGERRKAELVLSRLRQIYDAESESVSDHCVYQVVNAAYQFWFSPDATQAPATVITGLTVTGRLGVPFWDVPMLNAALFRLASDENVEGLRNMLAILEERLLAEAREHDIAIHHHFVAYLAWLEDDPEKALIAIEAAHRIARDSGFCLSPVYYGVGQAAVLGALGHRGEAVRRLRASRREAIRQKSRTMTFMAHMVGAAMALRSGRRGAALAYLGPAFALGAAEGFRAVPWVRVADRNELCSLALERGITPDLAARLKITTPAPIAATKRPLICTLGRADILRNGRSELTSRKPQLMPLLLMLHLVAAGRDGRSGDQLIDALWPDADTASGRHRLKTTLYRLRKLVGDQGAICSAAGRLKFDESSVEIDAWSIERLIATQAYSIESAEQVVSRKWWKFEEAA